MNLLEYLTETKFGGDMRKASFYIAEKADVPTKDRFRAGMTEEQRKLYKEAEWKSINRHFVGGFDTFTKEYVAGDELGVGLEELRDWRLKTELKSRALKNTYKILLIQAAVVLVNLLPVSSAFRGAFTVGLEAPSMLVALDIARDIINYFRLKKLERVYNTPEFKEQAKLAENGYLIPFEKDEVSIVTEADIDRLEIEEKYLTDPPAE